MINKKEIVAMLLAGGQGSRLFALTQKKAKPAVSYGGKYKIIDFPLSNCTNSGIDTVGVLTQYEPLELNAYIGTGGFWDLDSLNGGAYVLPPYMKGETGNWYRGTADAIYQNINFIDNYDPDHIIVLSGDQICTMDYAKMLQYHKEKDADCTISVLNVTYEEAINIARQTIESGKANCTIPQLYCIAQMKMNVFMNSKKNQQNQRVQKLLWVFISLNGN